MNYWFIIGNLCFKHGSGKKYKIIYCKTVDLSEIYMYQLIQKKTLAAVMVFEDFFKDNGFFTFGVEEITIHVNKRNNIINISIVNHITEESLDLWSFIKDQQISWKYLLNTPMIICYESYIMGIIILMAIVFLIYINNDYILSSINIEKKLTLIQEIIKK